MLSLVLLTTCATVLLAPSCWELLVDAEDGAKDNSPLSASGWTAAGADTVQVFS